MQSSAARYDKLRGPYTLCGQCKHGLEAMPALRREPASASDSQSIDEAAGHMRRAASPMRMILDSRVETGQNSSSGVMESAGSIRVGLLVACRVAVKGVWECSS